MTYRPNNRLSIEGMHPATFIKFKKVTQRLAGAFVRLAALFLLLAKLPASVSAGDIEVTASDLLEAAPEQWVATGLSTPAADRSLPVVDPSAEDSASQLLRRYDVRGFASGFEGILYDNRDRGHSRLDPGLFPRLHHVTYDEALRQNDMDYGLAGQILYPAVVFGNSSTALTGGTNARSLPRLALTSQLGAELSERLYRNNHLYVYPEPVSYTHLTLPTMQ